MKLFRFIFCKHQYKHIGSFYGCLYRMSYLELECNKCNYNKKVRIPIFQYEYENLIK